MNISKTNTDALNATITVQIAEADYRPSVEKALENMRKNATVPGFRKGMVPAGMIKKQYGVAATVEEVNKLVQTELDNYIRKENLAIFGQPLPVSQQEIDWANATDLSFDFEIGIIPEVKIDLAAAKKVTKYTIKVSDDYINDHISSLTKRFGKISDVEKVVVKELETDVFKLTNALQDGNKKEIILLYQDLVKTGNDPVKLLGLVSKTIKDTYNVCLMLENGYKQIDIANTLGVSTGRAYYIIKSARSFKIEVLEKLLLKLHELDFQIKSGRVDKNTGFEMFLFGYNK